MLTFNDQVDSVQKIIRNDTLKDILNDFQEEYDFIFIDTPPCGVISDASIMARVVESIIYVIRQDAVYQASIRSGINSMLETDAKFLGCLLNGVAGGIGGYGGNYRYSGYYKYYNYSSKYGYSKNSRTESKSVSEPVSVTDSKNEFNAVSLNDNRTENVSNKKRNGKYKNNKNR